MRLVILIETPEFLKCHELSGKTVLQTERSYDVRELLPLLAAWPRVKNITTKRYLSVQPLPVKSLHALNRPETTELLAIKTIQIQLGHRDGHQKVVMSCGLHKILGALCSNNMFGKFADKGLVGLVNAT